MCSERSVLPQTWALAGHLLAPTCTLEPISSGACLSDDNQDQDEGGAREMLRVQIRGGTRSCCVQAPESR